MLFASLFMAEGLHHRMSSNEDSSIRSQALVKNKLLLNEDWSIQSSDLVNENGSVISTIVFNPFGWYPASVPSTVLAALVENGVYPDPYFGVNLKSIPDLTGSSWWYRTEFALPQEYTSRSIWLDFDGINYKANIWLNGQMIADSTEVQGMFRLFEFDITDHVTFAGNNCLAVEVFAPTYHDLWDSWVDWNPTPPDKDMGIWQDVYVDASGPVVVRHPYVCSSLDLPSLDLAHLNISVELTNVRNATVNGLLEGTIQNVTNLAEGGTSVGGPGDIEFSEEVSLGPKESRSVMLSANDIAQLNVLNPRLWWPDLVGPQNLYDLRLEFEIAGELSDSEIVCFGIREFSSSLSDKGYRIFSINGRNILVRGGGWCPDMMLRLLPERQEAEIKYARDMNLNAIRMEGKLGTDGIWDLCDKYGIMIMAGWCCCSRWEEWGSWDATDITVAVESLRDQILRLRNHPSFLVWLYGSDNPPPPSIENDYLDVLNTYAPTLPHLSSATEESTPITGPTGVKMRGPYSYEPPVYYYLEQSPGGAYSFGTEMGPGENVPPIESVREMLPEDHLWPIDEFWDYHCGSNQPPFMNLNIYTNALDFRYGTANGLDEYCEKAQLMNYESIRAELEAFCRNKYLSTGVITWQYNSAWPRLIWQDYDYSLRPGGSFFGAMEACEPLHAQYSYDDSSIYVVNSYYESFRNVSVKVRVYDLDMTERYSNNVTIDVGPDSSNYVLTIPSLENLTTTYFLRLTLENSSNDMISSNFYWLSTRKDALNFDGTTWYYTPQSNYADFTDLKKLPAAQLNLSYYIEDKGDDLVAHITMGNPTNHLAFFVHLKVTKGPQGEDVLPILWSANYLSLLPGESEEVSATFAAKDLDGAIPVVEAVGFNVPDRVFSHETQVLIHDVTIGSEAFKVVTESNYTVGDFVLDGTYAANDFRGEINFSVTGLAGTAGFCNITIPKDLMKGEPEWLILVDGISATYHLSENETYTCLYFEFADNTHIVHVHGTWAVPEFLTFASTLLLIIATISAVEARKKAKRYQRTSKLSM
jgi:exo-1,4-beta-D-glucosaminidase